MFGFATLDAYTTVTQWSDGLRTLTGLSAHDAVGHFLVDLFPSLRAQGIEAAIQHVIDVGAPFDLPYGAFSSPDGSLLQCDGQLHPLMQAGRTTGVLLTLQSAADQMPVIHDLRERLREAETRNQINQAILTDDLNQAMRVTVDQASALFQGAVATLYLDEDTHCNIYTSSLSGVSTTQRDHCAAAGLCDALKNAGKPMCVSLPAQDSLIQGAQPSTQALLAIPLMSEGNLLGILYVESRSAAGFSESAVTLLQPLAAAAASAVTNARMHQTEKQRLEKLDILHRVSQALRLATSRDEIIHEMLEQSALIVKATHGMVVWPGKVRGTLGIIAAYHLPKELLRITVNEDNSISGLVYRTGQPYITTATQDDPLSHPAGLRVLDTVVKYKQSWMYAPIVSDNHILGVITLGAELGRVFTPVDLKLLSTVTEMAGNALHRMASVDQVKEHAGQLSLLNTISQKLAGTLDAHEACEIVTHSLTQQFNYALAVVSELDAQTRKVTLVALDGPPNMAWHPGQLLTQDNGINTQVFRSSQSYITNHASKDSLYQPIPGFTAGSNLCVPVIVDQQVIATINVEQPFEDAFQQSDIDLVETMAAQLGVTLSNARRFHTMQVTAERLSILSRAMRRMTLEPNPRSMAQTILQTTAEMVPFRSGCLFLVGENGVLKPFVTQGVSAEAERELATHPLTLNDGYYSEAVQRKQTIEIADTRNDPRIKRLPHHTGSAAYCAPLIVGERILAILDIDQVPPDEEARVSLSTFYSSAVIALQNAFQYEETVLLLQQRVALLKLATELSSATDDSTLHRIILANTQLALGVDVVTLILLNEDQQTGKVVANYFKEPWQTVYDMKPTLQISQLRLAQKGLSQHTTIVISPETDPTLPSESQAFLAERNVKAALLAPLIVNEQLIGLLASSELGHTREFTQPDLKMMQGIADQAAVALQRAQFYEKLRHYAEELEERVKARTAELQTEHDRTQAILDAAGEGIVMRDLEGRFLYVNAQARQITDLIEANRMIPDSNFWGKRDVLSHAERQRLSSMPLNSRKIEELSLQKEDGGTLHISMTMPPVPGPEGRPIGIVGVFQDVTRLKELDRMKSIFVSNVSHELRTPITSLKLYLELLPNAGHEKATRYMDTLSRETRRLESMVEDLLVISRLDLGTTRPRIEPVNLRKLLTQVLEDRQLIAEQRDLSLDFVCAPDIPSVASDEHFIVQIITNLLSNAFNYTPPGGRIQVSASYHPEHEARPVSLTVSDDGPGIRADELPHLFERFYRGTAGLNSQAPGTGLGLSIVKELVDRLGGQISIDSIAGQGATITVTFPIIQPAESPRRDIASLME
jgi:PAS domain S-box-containing protein